MSSHIQAAGAEIVDADDWVPHAAGNMRWAFFPFFFAERSARSTEKVFLLYFVPRCFFFCPFCSRDKSSPERGYCVPPASPLSYLCFTAVFTAVLLLRRGLGAMLFNSIFFFCRWSSLWCADRGMWCCNASATRSGIGCCRLRLASCTSCVRRKK